MDVRRMCKRCKTMRLAISFSREKFSHHKDHEENICFRSWCGRTNDLASKGIDESWTHHTRIIFPGCFVFHHTVRQLTENVEIVNLCCRRGKRRNGRESERKLMRENSKKTPHTSCDLMRLRLGMAISISRWFVTITTNMSMAYEMKLLVGFSLPRKRKNNSNQSYSRATDQQHSDFSTFLKEKNLRMDRLANESYAIRAWLMTAAKKRISPETTLLAGPIRYNEFYNIIQKKREI